jgi:hypothetical protein
MKNTFIILFSFCVLPVFSQLGAGTTSPSPRAILDLTATDKGFLLPRMTSTQRIAILPNDTTDKGLQVFDTDTNSIWFWDGTSWIQRNVKNIYDMNGDISPTVATNRTVNFTSGGSLNFDSNTLFIDATNNRVGIGTNTPTSTFEVNGSASNATAINAGTTLPINFTSSNLAYSTSTATTISLSGIKDGGSYTLVFPATNLNTTATFTSTGFTFYYLGTVVRTNTKRHIYNFIVMGTSVYVTMATQN